MRIPTDFLLGERVYVHMTDGHLLPGQVRGRTLLGQRRFDILLDVGHYLVDVPVTALVAPGMAECDQAPPLPRNSGPSGGSEGQTGSTPPPPPPSLLAQPASSPAGATPTLTLLPGGKA